MGIQRARASACYPSGRSMGSFLPASAGALALAWVTGCALAAEGTGSGGGLSPPNDSGSGGGSGVGGQSTGATGGVGLGGSDGGAGSGSCPNGGSCVPQVPSGWVGYARLFTLEAATAPPVGADCPDGATPTRYKEQLVTTGSCSACTCGGLASGSCSAEQILCTTANKSCSGASDWSGTINPSCNDTSSLTLSCLVNPATVTFAGHCEPSVSAVAGAEPFESVTDVCREPPSGGCGAAAECVAPGSHPYTGYVCIEQPGAQDCPADWPVRQLVYSGVSDTRACSPCACSAPNTTCLPGEFSFWGGLWCSLEKKTLTPSGCKDLSTLIPGGVSYRRTKDPTPTGTCTPSGGQFSGTVAGTGPITFCCRT